MTNRFRPARGSRLLAGLATAAITVPLAWAPTVSAVATSVDPSVVNAADVTLTGKVVDGSGHGWPVHAQLSVVGSDAAAVSTDPVTGTYELPVPATGDYEVAVDPLYPGYVSRTMPVSEGSPVLDVDVSVDSQTCEAPGYTALHEQFSTGDVPPGWEVVDHVDTGQVWEFDDPGDRGNHTGGDGAFAIIDSWNWGAGPQDTSLVSPVMDLTGVAAPTVRFATEYRQTWRDVADLDVSVDGGQTWTNVWRQRGFDIRGPRTVGVSLPQAAGQNDVRLRWHFHVGSSGWWWQVDNVVVRDASCRPVDGGLVVGQVTDGLTGLGVGGANVAVDGVHSPVTTSESADGPSTGAGFYVAFSQRLGAADVTASAAEYQSASTAVEVAADAVVRADLALAAGRIEVSSSDLAAGVNLGEAGSTTLDIVNTGTAPASVRLLTRDRGFSVLQPDGSGDTEVVEPRTLDEAASEHDVSAAASWEARPDYPIWIMDNVAGAHDGLVYSFGGATNTGTTERNFVFDPATQTWSEIAPMPTGREAMSGMFVDGRFFAIGGYSNNRHALESGTLVYDPAADAWTAGADNPAPRAAAGTALLDGYLVAVGGCDEAGCGHTDVMAYDVTLDEYVRLADYPEPISRPACAGVSGTVYCFGGTAANGADTRSAYAYDPDTDAWTRVTDAPRNFTAAGAVASAHEIVITAGMMGGAGSRHTWLYQPASDTWTTLPSMLGGYGRAGLACGAYRVGGTAENRYPTRRVESLAGFDQCEDTSPDSPWLSLNRTEAVLQPGESVTVALTMDSAGTDQPGVHRAQLRVIEDTPYDVGRLGVAMETTVRRSWGALVGTVSGQTCAGDTVPLERVTVSMQTRSDRSVQITGADGRFLRWILRADNPVTLIVGRDGYTPQSHEIRVGPGATTHDITLTETGC